MATQVDICNIAMDMLGEANVTNLSTDGTKRANLLSRRWDYAVDELLRDHPWRFARKHVQLEYTKGYGIYQTSDEKDITDITKAQPAVVTSVSHGWLTDYLIKIYDVVGMTELNDRIFKITQQTADAVALTDIDSRVYTAYVSGGKAIRYEVAENYQDGFTYDLPDDYLCDPSLEDHPHSEFEIVGYNDGSIETHRLLTIVEDAVLEYTSSMASTDVAKFPNHFIRALAATLARMLYLPLAKKGGKDLEERWSEFSAIVAQAKLSDSRDGKIAEGSYRDPILEAGGFE